jgi:hypothetical protein
MPRSCVSIALTCVCSAMTRSLVTMSCLMSAMSPATAASPFSTMLVSASIFCSSVFRQAANGNRRRRIDAQHQDVGVPFVTHICPNCRMPYNRPTSFLCGLPRTGLRCSPRCHPRNPVLNVGAICLVLCTKRTLQSRLFIGNDEQVEGQPE